MSNYIELQGRLVNLDQVTIINRMGDTKICVSYPCATDEDGPIFDDFDFDTEAERDATWAMIRAEALPQVVSIREREFNEGAELARSFKENRTSQPDIDIEGPPNLKGTTGELG